LLTWPHRDLNWKYDKGRKVAAKYMYGQIDGGE